MGKLYLLVLAFLLPALSHAQISWDFSTATPTSGVPAGVTVSAVVQGNNNGTTPLLSTTSVSSGYTGASGGNNAGAAANIGAFRPDTTTYFEWTLTPAAGVSIAVSQINFGSRSTGTGPQAYDIRTSLDNFATAAASSTLANNSTWSLISAATSISGGPGQAVTIRLYAYNGAGNASKNTANWRIDDLNLSVTTSGSPALPILTVSPSSLSFSTVGGAPSPAQMLSVGGANLTSPAQVQVFNGFEVSLDGVTYATAFTLPQSGGRITDTLIFVRLGAGISAGTVNSTLRLVSSGADSQAVSLSATVAAVSAKVVINQVYGGGGNSGSVFANDFIELFNDDDTTVNLAGWSVQYSSSAGTAWQVTPLTGTIPPHGYFLVAEAAGASATTPLPTPDVPGAIAMSGTTGKVLLSNSAAAQTGANPSGSTVIDIVGYGPSATGFEGSPAPVLTNSTADLRTPDGHDTNNNSTDFVAGTPNPRNSTFTTAPPFVQTLVPANHAGNVPSSLVPVMVLTKRITKGSGNITLVTNGVAGTPIPVSDDRIVVSNDSVVLQLPISGGNTYAILISAGSFVDIFNNAFPGITSDTSWTFSTFNNAAAQTLPFVTRFDSCLGSGQLPNGFTTFNVTGAQIWDCTTFGRDSSAPAGTTPSGHAVEINGFAGVNHTNEDWLISPRFDLRGTTFPLFGFWSRNAFAGSPLTLKISTDYTGSGDPTLAHWTDLNGKFPSQASDVWSQSANINLSAFKDSNVYIAFVYTSTTEDGSRWTVDDISLINSLTPPPPSLTLSTNNLEFGFVASGGSAIQKLIVTGNDLIANVTLLSHGAYSLSADSVHFSDSVTLNVATANNTAVPVFVRFQPTAANNQFIDSVLVLISDSTAIVNVKGNSIDPASTLSVIDWNLNWFGTPDLTLGPGDKALQKKNVGIVLPSLHADLYALEEICDEQALDSIVATMPGYAVVVGQYGSFSNPTLPGGPDPLNTVQKLAFVYNTAKISMIRTDSLLTLGTSNPADPATRYYNDWASGRFPYMLTANVTLSNNHGGVNTRVVRFINIHAKANTAPVLTAYDRRENGANALDSLLKAQYPGDNVMILGDFNDDLNTTITAGVNPPITSWNAFTITDSALYAFPTQPLSPAGQHSDVNFTSVIDNVILSDSMNRYYLPASATVRSDVATLVPKYGTTTTDHYPVFTQYSFTPPGSEPPQPELIFTGVKQGNKALLQWTTSQDNDTKLFEVQKSVNGRLFLPIGLVPAKNSTSETTNYSFVDLLPLPGINYYRLKEFESLTKSTLSDTVALNFAPPLSVIILPNPAIGSTNLIVANASGQYLIQIVDGNGSVVKQLNGLPSTPIIPVSLRGLRGIYTVKVTTATDVATAKLLVL